MPDSLFEVTKALTSTAAMKKFHTSVVAGKALRDRLCMCNSALCLTDKPSETTLPGPSEDASDGSAARKHDAADDGLMLKDEHEHEPQGTKSELEVGIKHEIDSDALEITSSSCFQSLAATSWPAGVINVEYSDSQEGQDNQAHVRACAF